MIVTQRERDREREREAETQAEGEAGSMQGARSGTRFRLSRIRPWAEVSHGKPLSHPGCPTNEIFDQKMLEEVQQDAMSYTRGQPNKTFFFFNFIYL